MRYQTNHYHQDKCRKYLFIRAILSNVEILLLDESTSNLDDFSRELIFKILKDQKLRLLTVLIIQNFFNYDNEIKIEVFNNQRRLTIN